MANSKIVLDRQAVARTFDFGEVTAGKEASVTIHKGTAALSTVVLDVKGSQSIGGDLNLIGNLNITGAINETSVTSLSVTDIQIRVNKGGTTAGAAGAGLEVEGDAGGLVGAITYHPSSATKFRIGDGVAQGTDIVSVSATQTLTNKSISGGQITSAVALATTVTTNANLTGDVTSVGNASTIAAGVVTNAKLANMASKTYKGRTSAATGIPEDVGVATLKTDLVLVKADVGLGNVDNTSDADKPVSSAQSTAIAAKQTQIIIQDEGSNIITNPSNLNFVGAGVIVTSLLDDTTVTISGGTVYFRQQTVTGTQDGSNKVFTIGATVTANTELVSLNGQIKNSGSSNSYILSGTTLTFQAGETAPAATDNIQVWGRS